MNTNEKTNEAPIKISTYVSPHVLKKAEDLSQDMAKSNASLSRDEIMDAALEIGLSDKGKVMKTLGL